MNQCFDDDDEERTLSTDTYLNELDSQQLLTMQGHQERVAVPVPPVAEEEQQQQPLPPKKPNPMILNLAHKFNKLIEGPRSTAPVIEQERPIAKRKSGCHTSRIQKQISLYERDKGMEERVAEEGSVRQRSHRSVERMETAAFVVAAEKSHNNCPLSKTIAPAPSKTKSCANLKNCYASPGALIVKENFIEPPRRVPKSFHGRTDLQAVLAGGSSQLRVKTSPVGHDKGGLASRETQEL